MAKPINETPVLKGQDAKNFISDMKASENTRLSPSEKERIKRDFAKIKAIVR
jgi:hypothetical protein